MSSFEKWRRQLSHETHGRPGATVNAMDDLEHAYTRSGNKWRPTPIAMELPEHAKAFAVILTDPLIADLEAKQKAASRSAAKYRSRFNRLLFTAIVASIGLGISSALQLYTGWSWQTWPEGTVIAGVHWLCLAASLFSWILLGVIRPYRRWLTDRSVSEGLRREIFMAVLEAADTGSRSPAADMTIDGQPSARQYAFEYFRVCLLNDQIAWLRGKSERAGKESKAILLLRVAGIVLLVSAACASVAESLDLGLGEGIAALLSIAGSALLTAAQAADSALLSTRNTKRYSELAQSLEDLRSKRLAKAHEAVRAAAPAEGADDAQLFALEVRELLAVEHGEWKATLEQGARNIGQNIAPA